MARSISILIFPRFRDGGVKTNPSQRILQMHSLKLQVQVSVPLQFSWTSPAKTGQPRESKTSWTVPVVAPVASGCTVNTVQICADLCSWISWFSWIMPSGPHFALLPPPQILRSPLLPSILRNKPHMLEIAWLSELAKLRKHKTADQCRTSCFLLRSRSLLSFFSSRRSSFLRSCRSMEASALSANLSPQKDCVLSKLCETKRASDSLLGSSWLILAHLGSLSFTLVQLHERHCRVALHPPTYYQSCAWHVPAAPRTNMSWILMQSSISNTWKPVKLLKSMLKCNNRWHKSWMSWSI